MNILKNTDSTNHLPKTLSTKEAADILKVEIGTLSKWRCNGTYPALKFAKSGARKVIYFADNVYDFLQSSKEIADSHYKSQSKTNN